MYDLDSRSFAFGVRQAQANPRFMIGYQLTINANRYPDATAVVFGARRISYAGLNERACRLANGLTAMGVGRGDRIAVMLHNCTPVHRGTVRGSQDGRRVRPDQLSVSSRARSAHCSTRARPKVLLAGEGLADVLRTLEQEARFPPHRIWVNDRPLADPTVGAGEFLRALARRAVRGRTRGGRASRRRSNAVALFGDDRIAEGRNPDPRDHARLVDGEDHRFRHHDKMT